MALTLDGDICRPETSVTWPRYSTADWKNSHLSFHTLNPYSFSLLRVASRCCKCDSSSVPVTRMSSK